jgi:hypothetical protein
MACLNAFIWSEVLQVKKNAPQRNLGSLALRETARLSVLKSIFGPGIKTEQEAGEKCIMRSFIISTLCQILCI